jgi:heavy metal sensor kinase
MKKTIFSSIRFKLVLWYILVLCFVIGLSDFFLYKIFQKSLIDTVDNSLYSAVEEVEHAILLSPPEKWQEKIRMVEKDFIVNRFFINIFEATEDSSEVKLVARTGILSKSLISPHIHVLQNQKTALSPICLSTTDKSDAQHPLRIILFPLQKNGRLSHIIQVGTSLKKVHTTMKKFQTILFLFAPIILIITSLGGYFILSRALIPVRNVVRTAQNITTEDLSMRIEERDRKDEIGELIKTFNDMIERLEKSVDQIKHFSTEVSHELKTPLTIIRGEIEIVLRKDRTKQEYKKTLSSVYDEAVKLQKMVNSLLFHSQIISHGDQFTFEKTALDEVFLKAFEKVLPLAQQKKMKLTIKKMDSAYILGEETLVNRMIFNILENAIKYTPSNGTVEISLENQSDQTVIIVKDNGIGIPKTSLSRVFDKFFCVDKVAAKKNGSLGLGLSIVKKIADMHRASIEIKSEISKGTTVFLNFPRY